MTCIVGVIDKAEGVVYIGADSAGSSGTDLTIRKDPKVFKVGDFLIGGTSSYRMLQILRFCFNPPKITKDTYIDKYMVLEFIPAVIEAFKANGYEKKEKEGDISGGIFLVGYKDRLFKIWGDFQVAESMDNFEACGCGTDYAKGSLYSLDKVLSPESRVIVALEAATHFSGSVSPPFTILNTKK